ncbi:hypothetical protein NQ315_005181 [Exocentrus adspersus]|uniref:G-protein coupled receptors family 1 profile domain-containing protein n=1 Tax=Exocentrus adspersus TaxID=1586481 RepID=A0AAV8VTQ2_9CUCU|nr:hypothetical protein NQ315_005181 [Exocentrus adspersus]
MGCNFLFQLRQIVIMNPEKGTSTKGCTSGGTMIRMLGVQQTNEVKATQNLAIIVLFFMICWIPLYTINCILAFRPDFEVNSTFMLCCIILSHLNSAGNPLLYAYHLRDFRAGMKNFFCNLFDNRSYCEQINRTNYNNYKVNKPVVVDAVGDVKRAIWNISEHSNSSSVSSKSLESCSQDKILMIRPATPYRPRNISEINPSYMITSLGPNDSDDDFNEDEVLPSQSYVLENCEMETCLSDDSNKHQIVSDSSNRSRSTSSPQLSRGLFFVECSFNPENDKTVSFNLYESNNRPIRDAYSKETNVNLSPFRMVNDIFRGGKVLNRSVSDGGNVATSKFVNNGLLKSFDRYYSNS